MYVEKKCDGKLFLLFLNVDDIIIAGSNLDSIQNLKNKVTESFDIMDLGELNHYLDTKCTKLNEIIKIDRSTYARDFVNRFENLLPLNLARLTRRPWIEISTCPWRNFCRNDGGSSVFLIRFPYQNAIGALLYLSISIKPDLSYSVRVLANNCINSIFKT